MNTSGEAADQVVRMSMEVGEAALKISGKGAKQLAVLLYAILKEQKKTRGRARLETLVRSGRPLTVFSVKESDLKKFVQEAKRYGILYCAVRNPRGSSDGMVDIMVKEEDAPRINRIVERFQFASVTEAAGKKGAERKSSLRKRNTERQDKIRRGQKSTNRYRAGNGQESAGKRQTRKIAGGYSGGRAAWRTCNKGRNKTANAPFYGKDRQPPSVRAYIRETRESRRGYY